MLNEFSKTTNSWIKDEKHADQNDAKVAASSGDPDRAVTGTGCRTD
jgi:hypothetical protein